MANLLLLLCLALAPPEQPPTDPASAPSERLELPPAGEPETEPSAPVADDHDDHDDLRAVQAPPDALGQDEEEPDDAEGLGLVDKPNKLRVEVQARVVVGALLESEESALASDGSPAGEAVRKGEIELRQARVGFDLRYRKLLRIRIKADFADFFGSPESDNVLRDAWAELRLHKAFRIKVGNFKRPYSRLELRGFSSVPIIGRGLYNDRAIEDLGWGDRAVGLAIRGKIEPERPGIDELRWQVSVSNHVVSGAPHGIDVHARVRYDPLEWLSIAAGGAFKHVEDLLADEAVCRATWSRPEGCRRNVFGASADLTVRYEGLYASVEGNAAQDWQFADQSPWMFGVLGYLSYDFELGSKTRLQPVAFFEFFDANATFAESEAVRAAVALNVLWTKHLRVMPQVQLVEPLPPVTAFNPTVRSQVYGVWLQARL